ncbi:hypothetical protein ARMGADRAFT_1040977 [Armillaria gallica]|uniref:Uncharacterized protein n=1 Tax=Armillaria gallica TaxID=47427 RepID=A0A2H3CSV9_ARMGA|nr:hypothetical protein ARMGADRAFT_1040977 [Armillaria gallica]
MQLYTKTGGKVRGLDCSFFFAAIIFRTQTGSADEIFERTIGETPAEKIKTEGNDGLSTGIQEGDFPDGGLRAWLVIVGLYRLGRFARLCAARFQRELLSTGMIILSELTYQSRFGFINAWGVFQAYHEETLLSDSDPSAMYLLDQSLF